MFDKEVPSTLPSHTSPLPPTSTLVPTSSAQPDASQPPMDSPPPEEANGCEQRWHNMKEANTRSMWEIYDETGVFVSLCRHSFVLLISDMVKSGEL